MKVSERSKVTIQIFNPFDENSPIKAMFILCGINKCLVSFWLKMVETGFRIIEKSEYLKH